MARDALGKLAEADELDKRAAKIKQKDPVSSVALSGLAQARRRSAIKQMRRRPSKQKKNRMVLGD